MYGYDNNVNLTSVTDPNNGKTQYGYGTCNRRNSRTDALQQTETWNYDGNGNLENHTDRNSQETVYAYDELVWVDKRIGLRERIEAVA